MYLEVMVPGSICERKMSPREDGLEETRTDSPEGYFRRGKESRKSA